MSSRITLVLRSSAAAHADDGEDADNDMIFFQPGRLAHPAKSLQPSFSELDFGKKSEENLSRALLPMPADSSAEQEDATGERRESVQLSPLFRPALKGGQGGVRGSILHRAGLGQKKASTPQQNPVIRGKQDVL